MIIAICLENKRAQCRFFLDSRHSQRKFKRLLARYMSVDWSILFSPQAVMHIRMKALAVKLFIGIEALALKLLPLLIRAHFYWPVFYHPFYSWKPSAIFLWSILSTSCIAGQIGFLSWSVKSFISKKVTSSLFRHMKVWKSLSVLWSHCDKSGWSENISRVYCGWLVTRWRNVM